MRKRLLHRVSVMIACHYRGKITLLTEDDFKKWRGVLMRDLTTLEGVEFAMAISMNVGRDGIRLRIWERKFCKRLSFIHWVGLRKRDYDFEGEDAQWHIDDFLEVYRSKHSRTISVETSYLSPAEEETPSTVPRAAITLITVTIHKPRTLVDWILNRLGEPDQEIRITKPSIGKLIGQGDDFFLRAGNEWYLFDDEAITNVDSEEAEACLEYHAEREEL